MKHMIRLIFLTTALLVINMHANLCNAQTNDIKSVDILSTNIKLLTTFSISCEDFSEGLKSRIILKTLNDVDSINVLSNYINTSKYSKNNRNVDVRIKLICEKAGGAKTDICTDGRHYILINGRLIQKNKNFLSFIKALAGQ